MQKYSLEDFPEFISTILHAFPPEGAIDQEFLQCIAEIIINLSEPEVVTLLINFWSDNVSEDYSSQTKAVIYKCLYIIYSSFEYTTNAYDLLSELHNLTNK